MVSCALTSRARARRGDGGARRGRWMGLRYPQHAHRMDGVREGAKARTKARGVVWCVACVTRETDEKVCDNVL